MRTNKKPTAFRQGRFGACEARLYEFRGRSDSSSPEEEKIERFAAESIFEGLVYLKRREPDFEVVSARIAVGIPLTWYPPRGPGRALISASGSYRG